MAVQHEYGQIDEPPFDADTVFLATNGNGTVCANAIDRRGATRLEGMYAHGDYHEEYSRHFGIRTGHVVVVGQRHLLVLIKFCSEANERANEGKKAWADCQRPHCVDLSPGSS